MFTSVENRLEILMNRGSVRFAVVGKIHYYTWQVIS